MYDVMVHGDGDPTKSWRHVFRRQAESRVSTTYNATRYVFFYSSYGLDTSNMLLCWRTIIEYILTPNIIAMGRAGKAKMHTLFDPKPDRYINFHVLMSLAKDMMCLKKILCTIS